MHCFHGNLTGLDLYAGDVLSEFFKLCCRKETAEEILGRGMAEDEGKGLSKICVFSRIDRYIILFTG